MLQISTTILSSKALSTRGYVTQNWTHLRAGTLDPENLGQVISLGVLQGVFKYLNFLHERQVVIVWGHLEYDTHNFQVKFILYF